MKEVTEAPPPLTGASTAPNLRLTGEKAELVKGSRPFVCVRALPGDVQKANPPRLQIKVPSFSQRSRTFPIWFPFVLYG